MKNKIIGFWGEHNKYGEFSNFYNSPFVMTINNEEVLFNCSEQAFMYLKAIEFKDPMIARQILSESNPKSIKYLGRKVRNFDERHWDSVRYDIMKSVVFAKFSQDNGLKQMLLNTGTATLVEASPYDRIWGVGVKIPAALTEANWKGKNLLGQILMEVREELK